MQVLLDLGKLWWWWGPPMQDAQGGTFLDIKLAVRRAFLTMAMATTLWSVICFSRRNTASQK